MARVILRRTVLLAITWWALAGGDPSGLGVGAIAVLVAVVVSARLSRPSYVKLSLVGLIALTWSFIVGSLLGGWDVARRALVRRMPLAPRVIRYPTHLAPGAQRHILTSINTLMPGSLSIDATGHDPNLEIHVLVDRGDEFRGELQSLESRVARAFQAPASETAAGP